MMVDHNSGNTILHRSSFPSVVKQWLLLMSSTPSPTHSTTSDDDHHHHHHHHHSNSLFESTYFSFPDYEALQQPELEKSSTKQCKNQDHAAQSSSSHHNHHPSILY
ncbi:hypothetical protein [Absidia glauca]|uniref:Uncharacterized protein n=1 Tax=Absidia glauca TaxID=4829 RepID=A0A168PFD6_ABSGL|nr:hypothetical protein [Absidia glauca]